MTKGDRDKMIKTKEHRQNKARLELGRVSTDRFKIGDEVRVYDSYRGNWSIKGNILEEVSGEDSDIGAYVILIEDGTEMWQNKRNLRLRVGPLESADPTTEP